MRAFRETQAHRKIKEIEELNLEQTRIVPNRLFCERERETKRYYCVDISTLTIL